MNNTRSFSQTVAVVLGQVCVREMPKLCKRTRHNRPAWLRRRATIDKCKHEVMRAEALTIGGDKMVCTVNNSIANLPGATAR